MELNISTVTRINNFQCDLYLFPEERKLYSDLRLPYNSSKGKAIAGTVEITFVDGSYLSHTIKMKFNTSPRFDVALNKEIAIKVEELERRAYFERDKRTNGGESKES